MSPGPHLVPHAVVAISAVVALVVAAAVLEGGALATVVALLALGLAVLILPITVIRYDERPEPRARPGPR